VRDLSIERESMLFLYKYQAWCCASSPNKIVCLSLRGSPLDYIESYVRMLILPNVVLIVDVCSFP